MNAQRKKLEDRLAKSFAPVKEQTSDEFLQVVDLLQGFIQQVAAAINTKAGVKAEVKLELGHLVNQGQEHRVVIRAPEIGLSDFVLRAFVPIDGYPVVLDMLAEGDRSCDSGDALADALFELSQQPTVQQRLKAIRQALSDESFRGSRAVVTKNSQKNKTQKKEPPPSFLRPELRHSTKTIKKTRKTTIPTN